ncbi:hypothetical protein THASP1DRAFT_33003 [Thamnocephalis sphaerospora]|uniref:Uncharacterized protein n=1 Tax=Thamnocephalis sphaerospora TaxID=78915 RepID=A0A4P9XHL5_9FUNG|nr:hypothetical protein THASP1DRAFT_33003 [Thamnocephalis sphaerospora]|eukprot:RKP05158.1 hypothetical protein THASP1DRAFT_33003 [Thamnocephalis sphaerospora]
MYVRLGYIQALEEEVLRLRSVELSLKDEVKTLQEQAQAQPQSQPKQASLHTTAGSFTPDAINDTALSGLSTPEMITINWDELYEISPESACCIKAAEATPPAVPWAMDSSDFTQPQNLWINSSPGNDMSGMMSDVLGSMTITATVPEVAAQVPQTKQAPLSSRVGLKCILLYDSPESALIAPYNWGTNHAYNLSTRLFNEYKSQESPQETQITNVDLDHLLQASDRLQLVDELTPVQVWDMVCKLDSISHIDAEVVTGMFEELSKYSYCNSFGTAISKGTIREAFKYFLGWSQSHDL